ncbi:hypothetical protein [Chondrinema litorale]|uniref:hypothetical protein n=1 Tax=Chondrinema litorale TaxID=2994555 RepID=UPI0025432B3C|nr:hypothetical protein [Chondrinema litorale]UZR98312.1 hypothetical protein OQ292_30405 [Chondrinema litorale]
MHYPNKLLDIETGRQFKQLTIFEDPNLHQILNTAIDKILTLRKSENDKYAIEFPKELADRIPKKVRENTSRELTGSEVRTLTAIVSLAQKKQNELKLYNEIDRAYLSFTLSEFFNECGIKKNKSGKFNPKDKKNFIDSLLGLHYREFLIPVPKMDKNGKERISIDIRRLVEIHNIDLGNLEDNFREKDHLYKITIDSSFFNFERKQNTYFELPSDLNKRLRKVTVGRQNIGVELFIKCLHQSYQLSKNTGKSVVEYTYEKLEEIMRLYRYKAIGQHGRITPTIIKAFTTAQKLGLIESWEESRSKWGGKKYILYLSA